MKTSHLIYLLSAILPFAPISCNAANTLSSQTQTEFQSLNHEIESLQNELQKMRKDALNNEMHAQPYMFDNWHEFAEDIKLSEENEKAIINIKKQIKDLKLKRDSLKDPQQSTNTLLI